MFFTQHLHNQCSFSFPSSLPFHESVYFFIFGIGATGHLLLLLLFTGQRGRPGGFFFCFCFFCFFFVSSLPSAFLAVFALLAGRKPFEPLFFCHLHVCLLLLFCLNIPDCLLVFCSLCSALQQLLSSYRACRACVRTCGCFFAFCVFWVMVMFVKMYASMCVCACVRVCRKGNEDKDDCNVVVYQSSKVL